MVHLEAGRYKAAKVKDSVRKALCVDNRFSSVRGLPGQADPAALRERAHPMAGDRVNSVAARIQPARRVQDFHLVQEWAAV
jgi:hypothetical protein